jgi:hypothetical protein
MRERDKQRNADHLLNHGSKQCQECGVEYTPNSGQGKQQKYCSKFCKGKVNDKKKFFKGGYSRCTYILLWLKARNEGSYTAPCFYCGTKLPPEVGRFVVEHKIPRIKLKKTKQAMREITNLVISCIPCNKLKGVNDHQAFKAEMASNSKLDVPEHTGEEHPLEKGEGVL